MPRRTEKHYRRVLVVAAHPDDPDFLAGGSVAKLAGQGASVSYVICSDGSQGGEDPSVSDEELIALRQKEQREAARILGVADVVFLGHRDGYIYPSVELRKDITREIRRLRPDLVITHAPHRLTNIPIGASHPDHIAVGEAALAAVYPDARNPRAYRELLAEGLKAFKVREVWYGSFTDANHYIELSEELVELKIKAISAHKSQFEQESGRGAAQRRRQRFQWLRDRTRELGKAAGFDYAESFHRIAIEF